MLYSSLLNSYNSGQKLLALLIDPDKIEAANLPQLASKINTSNTTYILVGGSLVKEGKTAEIVKALKQHTNLPIVLFPGSHRQLTEHADGVLYLTLLSGRNPEYLIGQHVKSASYLQNSTLEILSTGYLLIDGGVSTAVQEVSQTSPMSQHDIESVVHTALAGQFLGNKLVYLEAGSGAKNAVSVSIIKAVTKALSIPVIVGGGIRSKAAIAAAHKAGATMVVIGTAVEENDNFLKEL